MSDIFNLYAIHSLFLQLCSFLGRNQSMCCMQAGAQVMCVENRRQSEKKRAKMRNSRTECAAGRLNRKTSSAHGKRDKMEKEREREGKRRRENESKKVGKVKGEKKLSFEKSPSFNTFTPPHKLTYNDTLLCVFPPYAWAYEVAACACFFSFPLPSN